MAHCTNLDEDWTTRLSARSIQGVVAVLERYLKNDLLDAY